MNDDTDIADVLDTIGDEHARQILAALSRESQTAKQLADTCDVSLPTVYRRLDSLEQQTLVTGRDRTDEDGNEFRCYECNFESTVISLDEEYDVRVYRQETLTDRFAGLWDDLHVE